MNKANFDLSRAAILDARASEKMAVLVDGENISHELSQDVVRRVEQLGAASVRRVYGNVVNVPVWCDNGGFRIIHTMTGKNSADMRMAIDAMALSYEGEFETFVIVSSDGDFAHLAHNLRERHFNVIGIGQDKSPDRYRAACSRFIEIGTTRCGLQAEKKIRETKHNRLEPLDDLLRAAILEHGDQNGLHIKLVNPIMWKHGVKISDHPKKKWRAYMGASQFYRCDPKGPDARVRWVGPRS